MNIKILQDSDNLVEYMETVKSLNNNGVELSSEIDIKKKLSYRNSNELTFVGIVDEKIVCSCSLYLEQKLRYGALCGHIEDVGTSQQYRGLGYGKTIVSYVIDYAKKLGCYKIKLNCNTNLVNFYAQLGFIKDSEGMVLTP